jgi:predicted dienelactone hydrolase
VIPSRARPFPRPGLAGLAAVLLAGLLAFGSCAAAAVEHLEIARLQVAVWLPKPGTAGPWPVLVFSHGFHGCGTQSSFLTSSLADAGYAVFAPDHRDAACADLRRWADRPEVAFGKPARWTDSSYADRAQDIEHLLDALAAEPRFRAYPLDLNHVGLVGHSLGGYTVLGLAGAWERWKDPRVKAVLALSPYAQPFTVQRSLGGLAGIPVMYQGGTRDIGITPFVEGPDGAYAQSPAPKYFVEFDGAGHFAWTDLNPAHQAAIIEYSRAFLDHALGGKPFPPALARTGEGVFDFRAGPEPH